jgi:hypothetical protein
MDYDLELDEEEYRETEKVELRRARSVTLLKATISVGKPVRFLFPQASLTQTSATFIHPRLPRLPCLCPQSQSSATFLKSFLPSPLPHSILRQRLISSPLLQLLPSVAFQFFINRSPSSKLETSSLRPRCSRSSRSPSL